MSGVSEPRSSSVEWMLEIFDVTELGGARYSGTSDGGERSVVDGSQLLGQAIVAAAKTFPGRTVRSAHAVFVGATDPDQSIEFDVATVRAGRQFATAIVTATQGTRVTATFTVLLDYVWPDVIRHPDLSAPSPGPESALPCDMPMIGRELRLVDIVSVNDPDEVGPAEIDAWLRYDPIPERDDLRKALLAQFAGHLSISATMRGHAGVGTAQAHDTLSTAPMTHTISFHEPVEWDGWILYHHESTAVGGGMSYVRSQIITEAGTLIASFSQEGMIRAFGTADPSTEIAVAARF